MKKLVLLPVLLALIAATSVFAENSNWFEWDKINMLRVVNSVLEYQGDNPDADAEDIAVYLVEKRKDIAEEKEDSDYEKKDYIRKDSEKYDYKNIDLSLSKSAYGKYISSSKTLRYGEEGNDIEEIQAILNKLADELGYDTDLLKTDGKYGPATYRMVKWIQKHQGIDDDGVVGPKTKEKLEKLLEWLESKSDSDEDNEGETDDADDSDY